jgi:hypothetical protein
MSVLARSSVTCISKILAPAPKAVYKGASKRKWEESLEETDEDQKVQEEEKDEDTPDVFFFKKTLWWKRC